MSTLSELVRDHPELAKSIAKGAVTKVEEHLLTNGPTQDIWCDGPSDEQWEGPHVGELCRLIAAEIKRMAEGIVEEGK